jgi:hypothetical protein
MERVDIFEVVCRLVLGEGRIWEMLALDETVDRVHSYCKIEA